jgi:hypothetical protein
MNVASRTPEGEPHLCPICGDTVTTETSKPPDDSVWPRCGSWLLAIRDGLKLRALHWSDDASALGDSMQIVELVMEFEEEFDLEIPEDEAQQIRSVADLIRLLRRLGPDLDENAQ